MSLTKPQASYKPSGHDTTSREGDNDAADEVGFRKRTCYSSLKPSRTNLDASVARRPEIATCILEQLFDPDDPLAAEDVYALRLAHPGFSIPIIHGVVLRSIRILWNTSYRRNDGVSPFWSDPAPSETWPFCRARPTDSRPQFTAADIMMGEALKMSEQRCLV
jgi:hypothetical protein